MENHRMSIETGAGAMLAAKAVGIKVALGLVGAGLLFLVAPPGRPNDAPTTRKELGREVACRVVVAGASSTFFGDWLVSVINGLAPWLMATQHPEPFLLLTGALGWWVGRAGALWLYRRQDKDAKEIVDELKGNP
jgi:hypothetical protein